MSNIYKNKDGKRVPSVTTIIGNNLGWNKRTLMAWQSKMFRDGKDPDNIKDRAAELGTIVHDAIEAEIYGTVLPSEVIKDQSIENICVVERGVEQFKNICNEHNVEFLETEMPLVSEKYQYGGRLDGICTMYGEQATVLCDVKTSKGIYPEFIIQLSAYDNLLRENTEYKPEKYVFFHVSKDLSEDTEQIVQIKTVDSSLIQDAWGAFERLLYLHDANKKMNKALKS